MIGCARASHFDLLLPHASSVIPVRAGTTPGKTGMKFPVD